jgi:hypothetical protein
VCGLPGSGKTAHAKLVESRLHAIRFSPDEWMRALSLDLYDEQRRATPIATTALVLWVDSQRRDVESCRKEQLSPCNGKPQRRRSSHCLTSPPCSKHEAVRDKMKFDGKGVPGWSVFFVGGAICAAPWAPASRAHRRAGTAKGRSWLRLQRKCISSTPSIDNFDGGQNGGCGLYAMCGKIKVASETHSLATGMGIFHDHFEVTP